MSGPGPKLQTLAAAAAVGLSAGLAFLVLRRYRRGGAAKPSQKSSNSPSTGMLRGSASDFDDAVAWVGSSAGSELSTNVKLSLYGCFKQAKVGDCQGTKPWGFEAAMKWESWSSQRGSSTEEAMAKYVELLSEAVPGWRSGDTTQVEVDSGAGDKDAGGISMGPSVSTMGILGGTVKDASPVGVFNELVAKGDVPGVKAALAADPSLLLQKDQDGMIALHWAADRGLEGLVGLLLEAASQQKGGTEAMLTAVDDSGDTALHFAVNSEHSDIARL
eukprot:CAMPEP_0178420550 /NCGR_PEP_ID=MMETSP0689_2-20121128/26190_1 /TAXON_ID=160604 /ORGANISM="Amphidinium massartii, Strain CS-259" /LENGTH=273 /DNA_ID=CAMNT_0020042035 /DNA_START=25 /DNA_END=843 /DNA_ORIENTATION=+